MHGRLPYPEPDKYPVRNGGQKYPFKVRAAMQRWYPCHLPVTGSRREYPFPRFGQTSIYAAGWGAIVASTTLGAFGAEGCQVVAGAK